MGNLCLGWVEQDKLEILSCTYYRKTYQKSKTTAAVASMLEKGEPVQPLNPVNLNVASWMVTRGGGQGQRLYKYVL